MNDYNRNDIIKRVNGELDIWASQTKEMCPSIELYLFGSLEYNNGQQFRPSDPECDIDLLAVLNDNDLSPDRKVQLLSQIREHVHLLEVKLDRILKRNAPSKSQVSTLAVTGFEIKYGLHHSGGKWSFFNDSKFLRLGQSSRIHSNFTKPEDFNFIVRHESALAAIRYAQKLRKTYLETPIDGSKPFKEYIKNMPNKEACRTAALLRYELYDLKDDTLTDADKGLEFIYHLLHKWSQRGDDYTRLHDMWSAYKGTRRETVPIPSQYQLLLAEMLYLEAHSTIQRHEDILRIGRARGAARLAGETNNELTLLDSLRGPSLIYGTLNFQCKLLPVNLGDQEPRLVFYDNPESSARIEIIENYQGISDSDYHSLIAELSQFLESDEDIKSQAKEVHRRLIMEGSNAYPRLNSIEIKRLGANRLMDSVLSIGVGPSKYGIALIEERHFQLPTAMRLRSTMILNSLAVRVALYYDVDGEYWLECHQRKSSSNSTYKMAWDVSAAGYIDPDNHRDPEDITRISVWQAAATELSEELGLERFDLPARDHFYFWGIGRNDATGQLDILGACQSVIRPDPNRSPTNCVHCYDRLRLTPQHAAEFIEKKVKWVPTAILTICLLLEHLGCSRSTIRDEFSVLEGQLDLDP